MNPDRQTARKTKREGLLRRISTLGVALMVALWVPANVASAAEYTLTPAEKKAMLEKLSKSLQIWKETKEKCGGNYSYKVQWQNQLGFGHETVVMVRDNKVVERSFKQWKGATNAPAGNPADNWTEREAQIGSHTKGAPAKTMDQLYAEAEKILTTERKSFYRTTLQFDKQGILQGCYYQNMRYGEVSPRVGIDLTSLTLESPK